MKKKFSIVLAVIMTVCTLAIALVACSPKDPDPFTATSSTATLNELWSAWSKSYANVSGDTLGLDVNIGVKDSDNDLSIILQGGISSNSNVKEVLRFAVTNNKKSKNIVDVIANSNDGLIVNIDGLSSKPIKISEIKLPSIGGLLKDSLNISMGEIMSIIQPAIVNLIDFSLDENKVVVDPVKNGKKTYDVKYTFTVQANSILESIIDMIGTQMAPEVESVINEVKTALADVKLTFTANTTGNTAEKVKNPAKGASKYNYTGGTLNDLKISVKTATSETAIDGNNFRFSNEIPKIAIPTDVISLDTALLTSRLNGNIVMKDSNGNVASKYTYTINLDFKPIQLITTITECVNTKSAKPIIDKIIKEQQGKLFIEINHECGDICKIEHMRESVDGSVLAIAFSPEEFGNNRIYASIDLHSLLPSNIFTALGLDSFIAGMVQGMIPGYYVQFSFDVAEYFDLLDARANAPQVDVEDNNSAVVAADYEKASMIDAVLSLIDGLPKLEGEPLQIKISAVKDLLSNFNLDDGTYWTLLKLVDCLFPEMATINIDATYTNGTSGNLAVIDLYKRQKDGVMKNFGDASTGNHNVITGKPAFTKDANGNIKIFQGVAGSAVAEANKLFYNEQGDILPISYDEIQALVIDPDATGNGGRVEFKFNDLLTGEEITSYANIIEIVGLAPNNTTTAQEVTLVLGTGGKRSALSGEGLNGGIGSNINNMLEEFKDFASMIPQISFLLGVRTPEMTVKTNITLSKVTKADWSQAKLTSVGAIDNNMILNESKTYVYGDKAYSACNLTFTYENGQTKSIKDLEPSDGISRNWINNNEIVAGGSFTLDYDFCNGKYTHSISVKVNEELYTGEVKIGMVLVDGTAEYITGTSISNPKNPSGGTMYYDTDLLEQAVIEFAEGNEYVTYEEVEYSGYKLIFSEIGMESDYQITLVGQNRSRVHITFVVALSGVEETLVVDEKITFVGKIGETGVSEADLQNGSARFNRLYSGSATATVGLDNGTGKVTFKFSKAGTYYFDSIDNNGSIVMIKLVVSKKKINLEKQVGDTITITRDEIGVDYDKAFADAVANKFNESSWDKDYLTISVSEDAQNPTFTIVVKEKPAWSSYATFAITDICDVVITITEAQA